MMDFYDWLLAGVVLVPLVVGLGMAVVWWVMSDARPSRVRMFRLMLAALTVFWVALGLMLWSIYGG